MATRFLDKECGANSTTAIADAATGLKKVRNLPDAAGIVYDSVDGFLKYNDAGNIRTLVNTAESQAQTGVIHTAGGTITEATADGGYSISVPIPAGAVVHDIIITGKAVWDSVTSATLIVGDTTDDDGFFTAVNAKTTPAVGTSLRPDTLPGGTGDGAYLGDTNGEFVGPITANFGRFYETGSIITAKITKAGAGTLGRTHFCVVYSVPKAIAQVVA